MISEDLVDGLLVRVIKTGLVGRTMLSKHSGRVTSGGRESLPGEKVAAVFPSPRFGSVWYLPEELELFNGVIENYRGWTIAFGENLPLTGRWTTVSFGVVMCAGTEEAIKRMIDTRIREYPPNGHGCSFEWPEKKSNG